MAIAIALAGCKDLGRWVTPIFLLMDRCKRRLKLNFLLQKSPLRREKGVAFLLVTQQQKSNEEALGVILWKMAAKCVRT